MLSAAEEQEAFQVQLIYPQRESASVSGAVMSLFHRSGCHCCLASAPCTPQEDSIIRPLLLQVLLVLYWSIAFLGCNILNVSCTKSCAQAGRPHNQVGSCQPRKPQIRIMKIERDKGANAACYQRRQSQLLPHSTLQVTQPALPAAQHHLSLCKSRAWPLLLQVLFLWMLLQLVQKQ